MRPLSGLVAVLTLLTLELVRLSGPLIDTRYGSGGAYAAALVAGVTYAAPGLVAAVLVLTGSRSGVVVLAGTLLLGVLRLVLQGLTGDARVGLGLLAVAVAIAVLTMAVVALADCPGGGRLAASAVCVGAAAAVGLQLALGTWDAVWRHTLLGWAVTIALVLTAVVLAVAVPRDSSVRPRSRPGRIWALGPLLALLAVMLANPAFAAAQAGVALVVAGPVLGLGLLLAAWLAVRPTPGRWRMLALPVLGVAVALAFGGRSALDPPLVLVALVAVQLGGAVVLGRALEARPDATSGPAGHRLAVSAAAVGLLTIAPILLHQLEYSVPLPVPHDLVLVGAAAVLGIAAAGRRGTVAPGPHLGGIQLIVGSAVLLLGSGVAVLDAVPTAPGVAPAAGGSRPAVVLSWNLHYGVSPAGGVDLEQVARVIEAEDPDVVLLQEVARGWVQGGGVDMATWLSRRLGRPYAFAPAADRRFVNVVLSRQRARSFRVVPLPYGAGPQNRSALIAEVDAGGRLLPVVSVHLQHRSTNTPTRIEQIEALLAALPPGDGPVLIGGDLNATPDSPEVRLFESAGFVSAIDTSGDPAALTDPSVAPTRRIDWILGRGIGFIDARVLAEATWSDHLPVVATFEP